MSPKFSEFPDIEAVCGSALRNENLRAYSSIPNSPTYPLLTIERVGGVPAVRMRLDTARIQISAWGNSKSAVRDLADQARIIIMNLEGTTDNTFKCFVTSVDPEVGLTWFPDPVAKLDRYLFSLIVSAHTTA